jgi:hypothetical protein
VILWYGLVLGLSALVLVVLAVTGLGTDSVVDRLIYGAIGVGLGAYAVHLLFFYEGGGYLVVAAVFLIPIFAGLRLARGILNRKKVAAERAGYAEGVKAAEDWRAQRRW